MLSPEVELSVAVFRCTSCSTYTRPRPRAPLRARLLSSPGAVHQPVLQLPLFAPNDATFEDIESQIR